MNPPVKTHMNAQAGSTAVRRSVLIRITQLAAGSLALVVVFAVGAPRLGPPAVGRAFGRLAVGRWTVGRSPAGRSPVGTSRVGSPRVYAAPMTPPVVGGCEMFPQDNVWNVPVADLPLDPRSDDYVQAIGANNPVHPDFGSGLYQGRPIGIPYTTVTADQPRVDVSFEYDNESDPGPYPIPTDAPIEGGADADGDRHVLVVDRDACVLYELFHAFPQADGSWQAGSGAVFDLASNALRPEGWTSADAAGLPILAGLVRYDEVASGAIEHAIRVTAPRTQRAFVWPARHFASSQVNPTLPPMGQRFRLRADFDASAFSEPVRVVIQAMKTYGVILADNGSAWFISGEPDPRWDNDRLLSDLRGVRGADFEAVDESSLMLDPDSGQVRFSATATEASPTETASSTAPATVVTPPANPTASPTDTPPATATATATNTPQSSTTPSNTASPSGTTPATPATDEPPEPTASPKPPTPPPPETATLFLPLVANSAG